MNRSAQLISAWCGFVLAILFAIGGVLMSGWFPVPDGLTPSATPDEVHAALVDRDMTVMRIGVTLMMASMALLAPWGAVMIAQTRRAEGKFGVLAYAQLTTCACATTLATAGMVCWGAAVYRPDVDPEISRFAVDLGWHFFLFAWPPFTFWAIALGMAVLWLPRDVIVYPRWTGFVSIWTGFLYVPGVLQMFFKTGPFGYHGLISMWMPLIVFFIWIMVFSYMSIKQVKAGLHHTPTPLDLEHDDLRARVVELELAVLAANTNGNGRPADAPAKVET